MILYRPTIKLGDTFIGDVIEIDEKARVLRGCGFRTDEAESFEEAGAMALEAVGW